MIFMPGHGGGHEQFRHFARTIQSVGSSQNLSLDIFGGTTVALFLPLVNHNDEYTGLHGGSAQSHTTFLVDCINFIMDRYSSRPDNVIIAAHSMGGVVARSIFLEPSYRAGSVKAIVTLGTPHTLPVASFDWRLVKFYEKVTTLWQDPSMLEDVSLACILLGSYDKMVSTEMGFVNSPHVIHLWTGTNGCYPSHNPFESCACAADVVAGRIAGLFSTDGVLKAKSQRMNLKQPRGQTVEVEFEEKIEKRNLEAGEIDDLDKVFEIFGPLFVEIIAKDLDCLKMSASMETLQLHTGWDILHHSAFKVNDGDMLIIDGSACKAGLVHASAEDVPESLIELTPLKSRRINIQPVSHIQHRFQVRLETTDLHYYIEFNRAPSVVKVHNTQTGEILWYHDQATVLVRAHRNPFLLDKTRTDAVEIYFTQSIDIGRSLDITVKVAWWSTMANWLKRYYLWLISILFVASLQGLRSDLRYWKASVLLSFAGLLVFRYLVPVIHPSSIRMVLVAHALLSWIDPGPFGTCLVFVGFWICSVGILMLLTWLFSGSSRPTASTKARLQPVLRVITYACALLMPLPWSITISFVALSIGIFLLQSTKTIQRGFLMVLGTTWLANSLLLGVWPRNLQHNDFSLQDHAPWLTIPIAVAADLIGADMIRNVSVPRPVLWIMTTLVLAYGQKLTFMVNYITAMLSVTILVGHYSAQPQSIKP